MKEQLTGIVRVTSFENRLIHSKFIKILAQAGLDKQIGNEISFFPANYKYLTERKLLSKICKGALLRIRIQEKSVEIIEFVENLIES